jgi:hypothetical protein
MFTQDSSRSLAKPGSSKRFLETLRNSRPKIFKRGDHPETIAELRDDVWYRVADVVFILGVLEEALKAAIKSNRLRWVCEQSFPNYPLQFLLGKDLRAYLNEYAPPRNNLAHPEAEPNLSKIKDDVLYTRKQARNAINCAKTRFQHAVGGPDLPITRIPGSDHTFFRGSVIRMASQKLPREEKPPKPPNPKPLRRVPRKI